MGSQITILLGNAALTKDHGLHELLPLLRINQALQPVSALPSASRSKGTEDSRQGYERIEFEWSKSLTLASDKRSFDEILNIVGVSIESVPICQILGWARNLCDDTIIESAYRKK